MTAPINLREVRQIHKRFANTHRRELNEALESAAEFGKDHVKTKSNFKRRKPPGRSLKDATRTKVIKTRTGRILRFTSGKQYAASIDKGARPHVIRPRRKKFLRFIGKGGNVVFTRSVKHPGNKAYMFLWKARTAAGVQFERDMRQRMSRIAMRFGR